MLIHAIISGCFSMWFGSAFQILRLSVFKSVIQLLNETMPDE